MAIALSFPFCPLQWKHACCMPAGRPPRIGTLALAKIYADQSICMSTTDNKTWPEDRRHSVSSKEGHSGCIDGEAQEKIILCVCCLICSVNAGASDNISNNAPAVSFNMLITLQRVEPHMLQHSGVSNVQVRQAMSSRLVWCSDKPKEQTESLIRQRLPRVIFFLVPSQNVCGNINIV